MYIKRRHVLAGVCFINLFAIVVPRPPLFALPTGPTVLHVYNSEHKYPFFRGGCVSISSYSPPSRVRKMYEGQPRRERLYIEEYLSGWDLAEWLERLAASAEVASIPAFSDTVEYVWRQMKQCWIKYVKRKKSQKIPLLKYLRSNMPSSVLTDYLISFWLLAHVSELLLVTHWGSV